VRQLLLFLISVLIMSSGALALETFSGNTVSIDSPVHDDIFASGGVININAPVNSAVVAGGTVNINAPVAGDVFVAGGQVLVNSDVGGKVVAWGGTINIMGNVTTNAILGGGEVNIHPRSVIGRDAMIFGENVHNAGRIYGNLAVSASNFYNSGSAGKIDFQQFSSEGATPSGWPSAFGVLMILGYLVIGVLLIRFFPAQVYAIDEEIRRSPIVRTAAGFVLVVISMVLIVIVAVTVIGIPLAIVSSMALVTALMVSGLLASFSLGKWLVNLFKFKASDMISFVIGFAIFNALFYIPYAGGVINLIAMSLGVGAIFYALRERWQSLTGAQGPVLS